MTFYSEPALAQIEDVQVNAVCSALVDPVEYSTILVRSWLPAADSFKISNVQIFNPLGTRIYNGLPAGFTTPLNQYSTSQFTTKTLFGAQLIGYLTIFITGSYDYSLQEGTGGSFWISTMNISNDSSGNLTSRDSEECVGGGGP
jgi:hypothetical protein